MTGLVEQIQALAIDRKASVSDLLRMVKLAAAKLNLGDTIAWVEQELNGYQSPAQVPDYRVTIGNLLSHSPQHGAREVGGDPQTILKLATQQICEPIAALEDLVEGQSGHTLMIKLDERVTQKINDLNGGRHVPIYVHLSPGSIVSIIDRVRSMVLDWAIALEGQGIMGDGINFSLTEREKAATAGMTIHIGTLAGGFHQANITGDGNLTEVSSVHSDTANQSVFNNLSQAVENRITDHSDKRAMLELIEQMRQTQGAQGFKLPFAGLMEYAANYATVLGPFIPALTKMLPA